MSGLKRALKKFSEKERALLKQVIVKLVKRDLRGLDIKKLSGCANIFRVRKGKLRIAYEITPAGEILILKIERRSDNTYKF